MRIGFLWEIRIGRANKVAAFLSSASLSTEYMLGDIKSRPYYLNLCMAQPAWNLTHKMSGKYITTWQKTGGEEIPTLSKIRGWWVLELDEITQTCLVTSTCNDCSSDLSYALESQDSKYSDEQSKIKKKILPPCSWMKVFSWLCCPQWSPAGPCSEPQQHLPSQSHTPLLTFSLPEPREVATDGPWLWAALAQWGLEPPPRQEQG